MTREELAARIHELANHADRLKGVEGSPSPASLHDRVKEAEALRKSIPGNTPQRVAAKDLRDALEQASWGGGDFKGDEPDSAYMLYRKLRDLDRELSQPTEPPKTEPKPPPKPPEPPPEPPLDGDWNDPVNFTPTKEEQRAFFAARDQLTNEEVQGFTCRFTVVRGEWNDGQMFDPPASRPGGTEPKHILCNLLTRSQSGRGPFYLWIQPHRLRVRFMGQDGTFYAATVNYRMPEGVPVTFDYSYRAGHPPTLIIFEDGDAIESLAFDPEQVAAPLTLGPRTNIRFGQQIDNFQHEGHNETTPLGWDFSDFSLTVL